MPPAEPEVAPHGEDSADLKWLLYNQAGLDRRLERVENSVVFRALRAIGRFYSARIAARADLGSPGYREWRKRGGGTRPIPIVRSRPRFSLVVHPDARNRVTRAVESYGNFELVDNVAEVSGHPTGHPTGHYVATVGRHDEIYPGALEHFAAAAPADLIYSDEEELDSAGSGLRPIFKPDWSPLLYRSVDYLGGLTAIRRELIRATGDFETAHINAVQIPAILYGSRGRAFRPPPVTAVPVAADVLVSLIVCTRTAALLDKCLKSIRANTDFPRLEIVVVQHLGSSSAEQEAAVARVISDHGAKLATYAGPFNFAAMNNQGVHAASGSMLVFLNDDVTARNPDWLRRLAAWLSQPSVGAAGAKLTFPDGTLQHSGIAAWMIDGAWHPGRGMAPSSNWRWTQYTREVSAVTGACLAVRSADFVRLGGFDPEFPVNFNDVDLCFRLRELGLGIMVDVEAELTHDESRTRGGRASGSTYEERRRFFRKWAAQLEQTDPYYTPHLAQNNEDLSLRLL